MNQRPSDILLQDDHCSKSSNFQDSAGDSPSERSLTTYTTASECNNPNAKSSSFPPPSPSQFHLPNSPPLLATSSPLSPLSADGNQLQVTSRPLSSWRSVSPLSSSSDDSESSASSTNTDSNVFLPTTSPASDTAFLTPHVLAVADTALSTYKKTRVQNLADGSLSSFVLPETLDTYDTIRLHRISLYEGSQAPRVTVVHENPTTTADTINTQDDDHLPQASGEESHALPECQHPFVKFSTQQLQDYFCTVVDVKHALHLRTSMAALDIGNALESLQPKVSLYQSDKATLEVAKEEIELIRKESVRRCLDLNFYALESMRPSHSPSVQEQHAALFASMERILDEKDGTYMTAVKFLRDPASLLDNRLPFLSS